MLTVPHAAAEHGAGAERRALAAQSSVRSPRAQRQPVADELLDLHRHAEEMLEDVRQPFGVAHLPNERADVKELGQIRQRVAIAKRRRRHAEERADVDREAIVLRAIAVDVRLRLGPGPVEQREEPMMEEIEKPAERRIAGDAAAARARTR